MDDNPCGVFATPGLASSSNGENYIIFLFSERPVAMVSKQIPCNPCRM